MEPETKLQLAAKRSSGEEKEKEIETQGCLVYISLEVLNRLSYCAPGTSQAPRLRIPCPLSDGSP